jgi:hypothetical protein
MSLVLIAQIYAGMALIIAMFSLYAVKNHPEHFEKTSTTQFAVIVFLWPVIVVVGIIKKLFS